MNDTLDVRLAYFFEAHFRVFYMQVLIKTYRYHVLKKRNEQMGTWKLS